jgi:hypothetical protein
MDKKRRKEQKRWTEREGEGVLQRSQPRQTRFEATTATRRLPARFFLREDDRYEEEADFRENGQRPEQPYQ